MKEHPSLGSLHDIQIAAEKALSEGHHVPVGLTQAMMWFATQYRSAQPAQVVQPQTIIPKHEIGNIKDLLVSAINDVEELNAKVKIHEAISRCDTLLAR